MLLILYAICIPACTLQGFPSPPALIFLIILFRAPGYDIPTAIDVLTTGTYQRLPTVVKVPCYYRYGI